MRAWARQVAHEQCREGYSSGNIYDMLSPRAMLAATFPGVDYARLGWDAADAAFMAGATQGHIRWSL